MQKPENNQAESLFIPKSGEIRAFDGTVYILDLQTAISELARRTSNHKIHLADLSGDLGQILDKYMQNMPAGTNGDFIKQDYAILKTVSVFFNLFIQEGVQDV